MNTEIEKELTHLSAALDRREALIDRLLLSVEIRTAMLELHAHMEAGGQLH